MGLASEWLALQYLRHRHREAADETCWVSTNRTHFYGGREGDDSAGYDFCVKTPQAEWLYEVKSSMEDTCEFELTPNEMRVAASVSRRSRRRYRILYVPYVFSPDRWLVAELPNPMGDETRGRFKQVGHGSIRFRFERSRGQTHCLAAPARRGSLMREALTRLWVPHTVGRWTCRRRGSALGRRRRRRRRAMSNPRCSTSPTYARCCGAADGSADSLDSGAKVATPVRVHGTRADG